LAFLFETIRLAIANLRLRLLRSVLTALGIIFGVAAVITMVSIGEGSKRDALLQVEQLGARNIIIRSIKPAEATQQSGGQTRSFVLKYGLTRDDLRVIRENFPRAEEIVPVKAVGDSILRGQYRVSSQAFGTTPGLKRLANLRLAYGRYLTLGDLQDQAAVAVLGSEVAHQLFPHSDPLDQMVRIDDKAFRVVGVLKPVGLAGGAGTALIGRDLNLDMHIPITTARTIFSDTIIKRQSGSFEGKEIQISEVYLSSPTRDEVLSDAQRLRRIMNLRHDKIKDIQLIIPYELLESAKRAAMTWTLVLGFIAGISLLVGGIGIMNIMLATVTERTREIGIRRAIGATRKDIVWQFLVETSVLACVGGLIGVGLGIGLGVGLEPLLEWLPKVPVIRQWISPDAQLPTQMTWWSIILSFAVAVLTGLIFGIYPAKRAAGQDPIVALRHD